MKRDNEEQVMRRVRLRYKCVTYVPPGVPKTSVRNLRSGDSRLLRASRTQLCTNRDFLLGCPAAERLLFDHLRTPQILHLQEVFFYTFLENVFVPLTGFVRLGSASFPKTQFSNFDPEPKRFWLLRDSVQNKLYFLAVGLRRPCCQTQLQMQTYRYVMEVLNSIKRFSVQIMSQITERTHTHTTKILFSFVPWLFEYSSENATVGWI